MSVTNASTGNHEICSQSYRGTISLIQLWRTGVKRLTPAIGSCPTKALNQSSITWNIPDTTNKSTMTWSTYTGGSASDMHLNDVFINNMVDNNNIIKNNPAKSSYVEGWQSNVSIPWIKIAFTEPEVITVVRYANADDSQYLTKFKFYGLKSTSSERVPGNTNWEDDWDLLPFSDNTNEFNGPIITETFITAELNNNKKYNKYLFVVTGKSDTTLRLTGFEVFTSPVSDAALDNYLTPMLNDNTNEVAVGNSAACMTPYGIVVNGGFDGSANATTTTLLYWPHAINKYDGNFYQYGISRSLPNLLCRRGNHALVWHKGKIYAIGGRLNTLPDNYVYNGVLSGASSKNIAFIECLDYNSNMIWTNANVDNSTPPNPSNASYTFSPKVDISNLYRYNHGACSFGDEIFIFGGQKGTSTNDLLNTAYAWNPETKAVRALTNLTESLSPCCAVPYGSKIYVIGMNSSNILKIYEYTP